MTGGLELNLTMWLKNTELGLASLKIENGVCVTSLYLILLAFCGELEMSSIKHNKALERILNAALIKTAQLDRYFRDEEHQLKSPFAT